MFQYGSQQQWTCKQQRQLAVLPVISIASALMVVVVVV
jgi:hypothetical protein